MSRDRRIASKKVYLIGPSRAGKTALFRAKSEHKFFSEYEETIGIEYGKVVVEDMTLDVLVTSGNEQYRQLTQNEYQKNANAIVICLPFNMSFEALKLSFDDYYGRALALESKPFIYLVATKSGEVLDTDKYNNIKNEFQSLADGKGIPFFLTSANCHVDTKTAHQSGLNELFAHMYSEFKTGERLQFSTKTEIQLKLQNDKLHLPTNPTESENPINLDNIFTHTKNGISVYQEKFSKDGNLFFKLFHHERGQKRAQIYDDLLSHYSSQEMLSAGKLGTEKIDKRKLVLLALLESSGGSMLKQDVREALTKANLEPNKVINECKKACKNEYPNYMDLVKAIAKIADSKPKNSDEAINQIKNMLDKVLQNNEEKSIKEANKKANSSIFAKNRQEFKSADFYTAVSLLRR